MDFKGSQDIQTLKEWLSGANRITILSHTHPDGDALGSSVGMGLYLREVLGKDAVCLVPDPVADNLQFILPEGLPLMDFKTCPDACRERIAGSDLILLLDGNNLSRTEALEPLVSASNARKVLIDHHIGPDREHFPLVFSTPEISSASELLYWVLKALGPQPLPLGCLQALLTGMTTDTNNFANSVYPSTFRMASEIIAAGADRDAVIGQLYNNYRENRVRLFGVMQAHGLKLLPNGTAYMILTREILTRFDIREGETEGLVNVPLTIGGVRLSLLLKEDQGHFRVSIRSKKGTSARLLAQEHFHGGGHENASGGKLYFPADVPTPGDAAALVEAILMQYCR
ncbi:MAG: DHH family phosphoesterase [Bacteroidales bacterium]|nr:DHH family phosphoesterase [Bacteroidales bacterium]